MTFLLQSTLNAKGYVSIELRFACQLCSKHLRTPRATCLAGGSRDVCCNRPHVATRHRLKHQQRFLAPAAAVMQASPDEHDIQLVQEACSPLASICCHGASLPAPHFCWARGSRLMQTPTRPSHHWQPMTACTCVCTDNPLAKHSTAHQPQCHCAASCGGCTQNVAQHKGMHASQTGQPETRCPRKQECSADTSAPSYGTHRCASKCCNAGTQCEAGTTLHMQGRASMPGDPDEELNGSNRSQAATTQDCRACLLRARHASNMCNRSTSPLRGSALPAIQQKSAQTQAHAGEFNGAPQTATRGCEGGLQTPVPAVSSTAKSSCSMATAHRAASMSQPADKACVCTRCSSADLSMQTQKKGALSPDASVSCREAACSPDSSHACTHLGSHCNSNQGDSTNTSAVQQSFTGMLQAWQPAQQPCFNNEQAPSVSGFALLEQRLSALERKYSRRGTQERCAFFITTRA